MKIAIIDDEKDARLAVREFLSQYTEGNYQIYEAGTIVEGIDVIKLRDPDLIFLDVNFPSGSGFDILNAIPQPAFKTIFTTAYDNHAIKAFKYSAVDYLLKPLDPDDFKSAMSKAQQSNIEDLRRRVNHLEYLAAKSAFNKMAFPSAQGTIYIEIDEIINLESDGNYTTIYTSSDKKITVTRLLKEFEELLPPKQFFRTHKSFIVNLQHISEFRRSEESLILSNGHEIPVARRRKENLMSLLG